MTTIRDRVQAAMTAATKHYPAGSSKGGQFAPGKGSGGASGHGTRAEVVAGLRRTGYTGPVSYSMTKLNAIADEHHARRGPDAVTKAPATPARTVMARSNLPGAQFLDRSGRPVDISKDANSGPARDGEGDWSTRHGGTQYSINQRTGKVEHMILMTPGKSTEVTAGTSWSENSYSKSRAHADQVWKNRDIISHQVHMNAIEKPSSRTNVSADKKLVVGPRLRVKFNAADKTMDIENFDTGAVIATKIPTL